jgi:hypothetical protein
MKSARLALVICNHCLCFNIFPILPLCGMIKKVFGVVAGGGVLGLVGGEGIDCLRMFDFALLYLVGVNAVDVVDAVIDGVVESLHSQKPEMLDTTRRTRKGTHDESLRKDIFCVQGSADDGGSRRVFLCDQLCDQMDD